MEINELMTFNNYFNQMKTLAENVHIIEGFPDNQTVDFDTEYFNKIKLENGKVVIFRDEITNDLLCGWFDSCGRYDIYGKELPTIVHCGKSYTKTLLPDEPYVVIYDNTQHITLRPFILQYAWRMAKARMSADVNIKQQKYPRIFNVPSGQEQSFRQLVKKIDNNEDIILAYKDFMNSKAETILAPAPFVANDIETYLQSTWNEFCRMIGIVNIVEQKKERMIADEVNQQRQGHIVARYDRLTPLKKGFAKVNKLFGTNITVKYYDEDFENVPEEPEFIDRGEEDEL